MYAIDTNVLVYAESPDDGVKPRTARLLLSRLPAIHTYVPVVALAELFGVLVRKARRSRAEARASVNAWGEAFPVIEMRADTLAVALDTAVQHRITVWDAFVLAAAADAHCRLLLSEDLLDGFTWSGVTVANPFAAKRHPLLEAILKG